MKWVKVRFKTDFPSFVFTTETPKGPGTQRVGPFEAGQVFELPLKIALILVKKGRAEFLPPSGANTPEVTTSLNQAQVRA